MWDLRTPSGLLFTIFGVILCVLGLVSDAQAPLTEWNINLYSGLMFLVIGILFLWLARRAAS